MAKPTGKMRKLNYPLNLSVAPSAITPDETISEMVLDWETTDNDEKVTVTLELSLNEYVALASAVDVGSDIAYGENAILIWWIWVRSINPMAFCEQVNNCINTNLTTQISINNTLLSNGIVNPDQIQPITPQMDNRFPSTARDGEPFPPPENCDKDKLWTGILEIVTRLDGMGRDFLEQVVAYNDKAERIANIIDLVPLFGDIAADVITIFADIAPDLLNAYNAHSSQTVLEDTACALFELVCDECRYPTYSEIYDHYANAGISGVQDIASYGITALVDYLIGSNNLANTVIWYTMNVGVLYTLYLGGTFVNRRGTKWIGIWADIGEDTPNNGWELLCDGCQDEWCHKFDFSTGLNGWTQGYGTLTANGLNTSHQVAGSGTYSTAELFLDLTGITNVTSMKVNGYIVAAYFDNSSNVWWGDPDGTGTGSYSEPHSGGWGTTNSPRETIIDISDWSDISINLRAAAKASGQYTNSPDAYIISVELSGTGVNPFGSDNC